MMTAEMTTEEYQSLTTCQKVKKVLPKVLPLLLLSIILPTADVGTDLALITRLYTGIAVCKVSGEMRWQRKKYSKCRSDNYC